MTNHKKTKKALAIALVCIIAALAVLALLYLKTDMFESKSDYPLAYEDLIEQYSAEYGLDPYLVAAVIYVESGFDPEAVSRVGAQGLMQVMPETGEWIAGKLHVESPPNLLDPETNISMGTWYLNFLDERFGHDQDMVLAAYNAGHGRVAEWLENPQYSDGTVLTNIPYKETENYVKKVNHAYEKYKEYHEIG